MTELDLLKKEIRELQAKQTDMQSVLDEMTKPSDVYIKELARECARGNWQALKEHNRRNLCK